MSKNKNELMGLPGAIFTGIGSSIGVALVAYIGFIIASAGKASILSIFIGLAIGLCAGFPMYFLTKHMVVNGGQSAVVEAGLGKASAACVGYGFVASLAFMSTYPISIASYIISVVPSLAPYKVILSMAILILAIATLCFGVKIFERSSKFFSMLLLINLTAFVVLGLIRIVHNGVNPFDFSNDSIWQANGMNGVLAAIPLFAGTCTGFVNIGYIGNLISEPKKNVPKAILVACGVMSFFWIFLTLTAANVLPVEQVAGQPLTYVAKELMPEWMAAFFALTGPTMAILTTFIPGLQLTAACIGLVAARGLLPKVLAPRENSSGIDRRLIILIGCIMGVVILLNLPVNVVVANTAPLTSFAGVCLPSLSHVAIAFRRTDMVGNQKDVMVYRIVSVVGFIASMVLFFLSVRAITLTSAIINITLIVCAYAFSIWKSRKDAAKDAKEATN